MNEQNKGVEAIKEFADLFVDAGKGVLMVVIVGLAIWGSSKLVAQNHTFSLVVLLILTVVVIQNISSFLKKK